MNAATEPKAAPPAAPSRRDLRLDLFRGLALWLIFLDHIPSNRVSDFTLHSFGFSDAAEIFVFISGYTAAFVYGREMRERVLVASARILKRAWQVYVAHIFLFMIYMTEIAYVAQTFDNPLYSEEIGMLNFLSQPAVSLVEALFLRFQPTNLDILPLYIVLLLGFPPVLWLLLRRPTLALVASFVLYVLAPRLDWQFSTYPEGVWFFNPLAWQFIFVLGGWCALGGARRIAPLVRSRPVLALAAAYLVFGFVISLTWRSPGLERYIPQWLTEWVYPVDKTNLDVLRLAHFLALAVLTVRFVPADWPQLSSPVMRPAILCGQHSLAIFCLGEFLSLTGHFAMTEISDRIGMQIFISVSGIVVMVAVAMLLAWYKKIEGKTRGQPRPAAKPDVAGG